MRFSMNGFRRQLSSDTKQLRDLVDSAAKGDYFDSEDLVEAMNDLITHSNVINCTFDKNNPDFSDLSDLEIEHIEADQ